MTIPVKPRIYKWVIFGFALFYWTLFFFQDPRGETILRGQQQGAAGGLTFSFILVQVFESRRDRALEKGKDS